MPNTHVFSCMYLLQVSRILYEREVEDENGELQRQFLVRWKNHPEPSWEPAELIHVLFLLTLRILPLTKLARIRRRSWNTCCATACRAGYRQQR
jgi:hypothetical protein